MSERRNAVLGILFLSALPLGFLYFWLTPDPGVLLPHATAILSR